MVPSVPLGDSAIRRRGLDIASGHAAQNLACQAALGGANTELSAQHRTKLYQLPPGLPGTEQPSLFRHGNMCGRCNVGVRRVCLTGASISFRKNLALGRAFAWVGAAGAEEQ